MNVIEVSEGGPAELIVTNLEACARSACANGPISELVRLVWAST